LTARVVDGKALANTLQAEVAARVTRLAARSITPGLVVVLAGDDPASAVYVRNKARAAEACGLRSRVRGSGGRRHRDQCARGG
jgi:methylenetetrahydrofolate dehydrogenase (NADP+)/methenyltetrahydrofolate cyclohydrolase